MTLLYTKDVALINKYIRAKEFAYQMNFTEKFTNITKMASCFYKYYEDLVYINYNKAERGEFFTHLLSKINVADLASYRRFCNSQTICQLNLDEFFLKVFGFMLSVVK